MVGVSRTFYLWMILMFNSAGTDVYLRLPKLVGPFPRCFRDVTNVSQGTNLEGIEV